MNILELTDDELTLLFWMSGFCLTELPRIYKKRYESLMEKLNNLVIGK